MSKKYILVIVSAAVVIILALGAFFVFYKPNTAAILSQMPTTPVVIDDLPVWLLKGGAVAVYREIKIDQDSVSQQIVVSNRSNKNQPEVQVYETIPKELAQKASDLEFTVLPEIIKDDPVVLWSVGSLPQGEPVVLGFSVKKAVAQGATRSISDFWAKCLRPDLEGLERYEAEEKEVQEMMKEFNSNDADTKKALVTSCLRWWRNKYEKAQKAALELQQQKDQAARTIEPGTEQYDSIKQQAKTAIAERTQSGPLSTANAPDTSNAFPRTVFLSQDIFPSTLLGLPLIKVNTAPTETDNCYQGTNSLKFLSAVYQKGSAAVVVSINQYQNEEQAQAVPQTCVNALKSLKQVEMTLEKKDFVKGYPFWVAKTTYQGQPLIAFSFSALADSVIAVMIVKDAASPETDFRDITSQIISRGNVGCGGDSDCLNWVCETCVAGRKICSKGECVACTYNGHCKDGYECQNNQCKAKAQAQVPVTPPPATPPVSQPTVPVCGQINLSQDYSFYTYAKQVSPCVTYLKQISAGQISLRCASAAAQWRNYWVKQIEVGGTSKLRIKGTLQLADHSRFFTECSGSGVKSDNYVDLAVFSIDPRQTLGLECNRSVSESDWPKCAVPNSGAGFLAHCGVPKCSTSQQCDFEVDTSGQDFIYLVFRVSDAWLADIEGGLSSLEVCSR